MLVRQLEEEVVKTRQQAKETNPEIKAHIEALQIENDHLTREIAILKETIRVRWEQEAVNHATFESHFCRNDFISTRNRFISQERRCSELRTPHRIGNSLSL